MSQWGCFPLLEVQLAAPLVALWPAVPVLEALLLAVVLGPVAPEQVAPAPGVLALVALGLAAQLRLHLQHRLTRWQARTK
jgi:hypothetical protein